MNVMNVIRVGAAFVGGHDADDEETVYVITDIQPNTKVKPPKSGDARQWKYRIEYEWFDTNDAVGDGHAFNGQFKRWLDHGVLRPTTMAQYLRPTDLEADADSR